MPRFPLASPTSADLSDRVFSELVALARAQSGPLFPLHVGDTYRDPPEVARAESQRSADVARLHNYSPVRGEPELLSAFVAHIAQEADVAIDGDSVQVVPGATAGLSIVCQSLLDPGDEVLVLAPFWPLIRGMITARGARPVEVPWFDRADDDAFDHAATLTRAITSRTVAIYVNSPHNPTGCVLSQASTDAIANIATRHNLWVLCDEAYSELWYGPTRPAPLWADPRIRPRAVAAHTLSKSHGLAGARIGFIHGPESAMAPIRGVQTFQTYCAPRPMQLGAARALRESGAWVADARDLYGRAAREAAAAVSAPTPVAGTFVFFDATPHLPRGAADARPLLRDLIGAGVLLTPGSACGRDYSRWLRLCFTSVPPSDLTVALGRVADVLRGQKR